MTTKTPQFNTILFTEVWDNDETFVEDLKNHPIPKNISDTSATTLFWLLYARYGNNPIANKDINQWKAKVFSIIYQYAPTWEKRLEIQDKLRNLTDAEIRAGAKSIYNHAFNPSAEPSTDTTEEIDYINEQNTSKNQKGVVESYAMLWDMLASDVSEQLLSKFLKCFKIIVRPENPLLYATDEEEGDTEIWM